jgi:hypothetical protein
MKTAVSLPDKLFDRAEVAAKKLRLSRSRLYATAIADFLERQRSRDVTRRLNEVYDRRPAKVDPAIARAQLKSLPKDSNRLLLLTFAINQHQVRSGHVQAFDLHRLLHRPDHLLRVDLQGELCGFAKQARSAAFVWFLGHRTDTNRSGFRFGEKG